jgi:hypothetical protein
MLAIFSGGIAAVLAGLRDLHLKVLWLVFVLLGASIHTGNCSVLIRACYTLRQSRAYGY